MAILGADNGVAVKAGRAVRVKVGRGVDVESGARVWVGAEVLEGVKISVKAAAMAVFNALSVPTAVLRRGGMGGAESPFAVRAKRRMIMIIRMMAFMFINFAGSFAFIFSDRVSVVSICTPERKAPQV